MFMKSLLVHLESIRVGNDDLEIEYFSVRHICSFRVGGLCYIDWRTCGILVNHRQGFKGFRFGNGSMTVLSVPIKIASKIDDNFQMTMIQTVLMVCMVTWYALRKYNWL
ncbi:hypothetical protein RND71_014539 [Anisodus tanguticus]|uniref:Uncharacterized protein n=1 Tax=Anisodus tanguticus TaxID=243964 RepID=A0AAE1S9B1_9SOLA|nr:hypothetical protein RND71_014539 [Anisodus tanguticus]